MSRELTFRDAFGGAPAAASQRYGADDEDDFEDDDDDPEADDDDGGEKRPTHDARSSRGLPPSTSPQPISTPPPIRRETAAGPLTPPPASAHANDPVAAAIASGVWVKQFDAGSGKYYYFHALTRKTTWDLERELGVKPAGSSSPRNSQGITATEESEDSSDGGRGGLQGSLGGVPSMIANTSAAQPLAGSVAGPSAKTILASSPSSSALRRTAGAASGAAVTATTSSSATTNRPITSAGGEDASAAGLGTTTSPPGSARGVSFVDFRQPAAMVAAPQKAAAVAAPSVVATPRPFVAFEEPMVEADEDEEDTSSGAQSKLGFGEFTLPTFARGATTAATADNVPGAPSAASAGNATTLTTTKTSPQLQTAAPNNLSVAADAAKPRRSAAGQDDDEIDPDAEKKFEMFNRRPLSQAVTPVHASPPPGSPRATAVAARKLIPAAATDVVVATAVPTAAVDKEDASYLDQSVAKPGWSAFQEGLSPLSSPLTTSPPPPAATTASAVAPLPPQAPAPPRLDVVGGIAPPLQRQAPPMLPAASGDAKKSAFEDDSGSDFSTASQALAAVKSAASPVALSNLPPAVAPLQGAASKAAPSLAPPLGQRLLLPDPTGSHSIRGGDGHPLASLPAMPSLSKPLMWSAPVGGGAGTLAATNLQQASAPSAAPGEPKGSVPQAAVPPAVEKSAATAVAPLADASAALEHLVRAYVQLRAPPPSSLPTPGSSSADQLRYRLQLQAAIEEAMDTTAGATTMPNHPRHVDVVTTANIRGKAGATLTTTSVQNARRSFNDYRSVPAPSIVGPAVVSPSLRRAHHVSRQHLESEAALEETILSVVMGLVAENCATVGTGATRSAAANAAGHRGAGDEGHVDAMWPTSSSSMSALSSLPCIQLEAFRSPGALFDTVLGQLNRYIVVTQRGVSAANATVTRIVIQDFIAAFQDVQEMMLRWLSKGHGGWSLTAAMPASYLIKTTEWTKLLYFRPLDTNVNHQKMPQQSGVVRRPAAAVSEAKKETAEEPPVAAGVQFASRLVSKIASCLPLELVLANSAPREPLSNGDRSGGARLYRVECWVSPSHCLEIQKALTCALRGFEKTTAEAAAYAPWKMQEGASCGTAAEGIDHPSSSWGSAGVPPWVPEESLLTVAELPSDATVNRSSQNAGAVASGIDNHMNGNNAAMLWSNGAAFEDAMNCLSRSISRVTSAAAAAKNHSSDPVTSPKTFDRNACESAVAATLIDFFDDDTIRAAFDRQAAANLLQQVSSGQHRPPLDSTLDEEASARRRVDKLVDRLQRELDK